MGAQTDQFTRLDVVALQGGGYGIGLLVQTTVSPAGGLRRSCRCSCCSSDLVLEELMDRGFSRVVARGLIPRLGECMAL